MRREHFSFHPAEGILYFPGTGTRDDMNFIFSLLHGTGLKRSNL